MTCELELETDFHWRTCNKSCKIIKKFTKNQNKKRALLCTGFPIDVENIGRGSSKFNGGP